MESWKRSSLKTEYLLIALTACGGTTVSRDRSSGAGADSDRAFTRVQSRGHDAMGVDQYTSLHHFESLPDGGRISLQRDPGDSVGVAQIRGHMGVIAKAFAEGNFALPGLVHDREVPGTSEMAARRSRINYSVETLPGGGQLRLTTVDSTALSAIHEFLAFQRRDHRVGSGSSH